MKRLSGGSWGGQVVFVAQVEDSQFTSQGQTATPITKRREQAIAFLSQSLPLA